MHLEGGSEWNFLQSINFILLNVFAWGYIRAYGCLRLIRPYYYYYYHYYYIYANIICKHCRGVVLKMAFKYLSLIVKVRVRHLVEMSLCKILLKAL